MHPKVSAKSLRWLPVGVALGRGPSVVPTDCGSAPHSLHHKERKKQGTVPLTHLGSSRQYWLVRLVISMVMFLRLVRLAARASADSLMMLVWLELEQKLTLKVQSAVSSGSTSTLTGSYLVTGTLVLCWLWWQQLQLWELTVLLHLPVWREMGVVHPLTRAHPHVSPPTGTCQSEDRHVDSGVFNSGVRVWPITMSTVTLSDCPGRFDRFLVPWHWVSGMLCFKPSVLRFGPGDNAWRQDPETRPPNRTWTQSEQHSFKLSTISENQTQVWPEPTFPPSSMDNFFVNWTNLGITTSKDLYNQNNVPSNLMLFNPRPLTPPSSVRRQNQWL